MGVFASMMKMMLAEQTRPPWTHEPPAPVIKHCLNCCGKFEGSGLFCDAICMRDFRETDPDEFIRIEADGKKRAKAARRQEYLKKIRSK